jgi:hypothetical protein
MLTFPTSSPQTLLDAFKKAIKDGDITTWSEDKDGDFTHLASQWKSRAWLRPIVNSGSSLAFKIIFSTNESQKRLVYSYYHGHLIETFLNHFSNSFSPDARATAKPSGGDGSI